MVKKYGRKFEKNYGELEQIKEADAVQENNTKRKEKKTKSKCYLPITNSVKNVQISKVWMKKIRN